MLNNIQNNCLGSQKFDLDTCSNKLINIYENEIKQKN